jgi:hypothetical protein
MEPKKEYPTHYEVVAWANDKFPNAGYYTPGAIASHVHSEFIAPLIDRCKAAEGDRDFRKSEVSELREQLMFARHKSEDRLVEIKRLEKLVAELSAKITAAQEALDPEPENYEFDEPAFVRFGRAIGEALTAGKVSADPLPWWQNRATEQPKPKLYHVRGDHAWGHRSYAGRHANGVVDGWQIPSSPETDPRPLNDALDLALDFASKGHYTNIRIEEAK